MNPPPKENFDSPFAGATPTPYPDTVSTTSESLLSTTDNEWTNIQDVVKSTFRAMHQVIVEQQTSLLSMQGKIQDLEAKLEQNETDTQNHLTEGLGHMNERLDDIHRQLQGRQDTQESRLEQKLDLTDFEDRMAQLRRELESVRSNTSQELHASEQRVNSRLEQRDSDLTKKFTSDTTQKLVDLETLFDSRLGSVHAMLHKKPTIEQIQKDIKKQLIEPLRDELIIENNTIRDETKNRLDIVSRSIDTIVKECNANTDVVNSLKNQIMDHEKKYQFERSSSRMDVEKYVQHLQDLFKQQMETQFAQRDHVLHVQLSELKQSLQNEFKSVTNTNFNGLNDTILEGQKTLKNDLLGRFTSQISDVRDELSDKITVHWKELDLLKLRLKDDIADLRSFFLTRCDEWKEMFVQHPDLNQVKSYLHERLNETVDQVHSQWKDKLNDQVAHLQQLIKDTNDNTLHTVQHDLAHSYVDKSDYENVVRTLQESLRTSFDLHQQEKRARLAVQTEIDTKFTDYTEKLKFLISQIEKSVKQDDLRVLLDKKADVRTMNQWIQQHTQDVNEVLDMKANLDDLLAVKDELKKKVDEKLIQELRNEIYELSDMRNKLSTIMNQVSSDYVNQSTLREVKQEILSRMDKRIMESTSTLNQQLREVSHTLSEKCDRQELDRQVRSLSDKKLGREDLIPLREELLPSREAISNCVTLTDFKLFTSSVQQELRNMSKTKLDTTDYNYMVSTLKNFITRKDVDSIMDTKVASLRRSIDTLHRSIGQLLVTSNSSIAEQPKLPKTPHVQGGLESASIGSRQSPRVFAARSPSLHRGDVKQ